MDEIKGFLKDFKENWRDSYWWADHQWLMYIILGAIGLFYSLLTEYLRLSLRANMEGASLA